jgi:bacterioferritin-associated ferredoxin
VRQHPQIQPLVASRLDHLICPVCSYGELQQHQGLNPPTVCCGSCGCTLESAILKTLEQIVVLPDALGEHACECGHPEMRRLPDDVFHYPACSSEVLPILPRVKAEQNTEAIMKGRYTR